MIIIDAQIFETEEIINVSADENAPVSELLLTISAYTGKDLSDSFLLSKNNKYFISKKLSFKEQGICGGDRLIIISHEKEDMIGL